jgi:hypothetical protein
MTETGSNREAAVLQILLPRLEAEGYEVFIQPSPKLLPPFMQGYRPDAIAVKPGRNLAIEIQTGGKERGDATSLERARALFYGHEDWEFRVLYAPSEGSDADLSPGPQSKAAIAAALDRLPSLYDQGGAVAALLTGWSAFEAAARHLMPEDFERPQPPSLMLETLASRGAVTPDEADLLRRLGRLRNQAAHGKLDIVMTESELEQLVAVTHLLLELTEPAGAA